MAAFSPIHFFSTVVRHVALCPPIVSRSSSYALLVSYLCILSILCLPAEAGAATGAATKAAPGGPYIPAIFSSVGMGTAYCRIPSSGCLWSHSTRSITITSPGRRGGSFGGSSRPLKGGAPSGSSHMVAQLRRPISLSVLGASFLNRRTCGSRCCVGNMHHPVKICCF